MTIRLDIVTAERLVYSDDVDVVVAPGIEGEMAILPHHAPLMTTLQPGELRVRHGSEEFSLAVTGGFLILSFLPHIAWQAHFGGLVLGLMAGYFFRGKERYSF